MNSCFRYLFKFGFSLVNRSLSVSSIKLINTKWNKFNQLFENDVAVSNGLKHTHTLNLYIFIVHSAFLASKLTWIETTEKTKQKYIKINENKCVLRVTKSESALQHMSTTTFFKLIRSDCDLKVFQASDCLFVTKSSKMHSNFYIRTFVTSFITGWEGIHIYAIFAWRTHTESNISQQHTSLVVK